MEEIIIKALSRKERQKYTKRTSHIYIDVVGVFDVFKVFIFDLMFALSRNSRSKSNSTHICCVEVCVLNLVVCEGELCGKRRVKLQSQTTSETK